MLAMARAIAHCARVGDGKPAPTALGYCRGKAHCAGKKKEDI